MGFIKLFSPDYFSEIDYKIAIFKGVEDLKSNLKAVLVETSCRQSDVVVDGGSGLRGISDVGQVLWSCRQNQIGRASCRERV